MHLMCGSIWTIQMSESKQSSFCFTYSTPIKGDLSFITVEGKPSISPVLIFILSMPGNERAKPGDSQKPKTNHSRKLFRVFCAFCPLRPDQLQELWRSQGVGKILKVGVLLCKKITFWSLPLPFFSDYSMLVKIYSKEGHPNSMTICQMRRDSLRIS